MKSLILMIAMFSIMLTAITIAIALFIDLFFLPTLLIGIDKIKFGLGKKESINL